MGGAQGFVLAASGRLAALRAATGLLRASLRSGPASGGDCFAPSGSLAREVTRRWEPLARRAPAAASSLGSPAACARDVVLRTTHHRHPEKIDHRRLLG